MITIVGDGAFVPCGGTSGRVDKMPKKGTVKLSIPTIASGCKIWYHWRIQVGYAYSTK